MKRKKISRQGRIKCTAVAERAFFSLFISGLSYAIACERAPRWQKKLMCAVQCRGKKTSTVDQTSDHRRLAKSTLKLLHIQRFTHAWQAEFKIGNKYRVVFSLFCGIEVLHLKKKDLCMAWHTLRQPLFMSRQRWPLLVPVLSVGTCGAISLVHWDVTGRLRPMI